MAKQNLIQPSPSQVAFNQEISYQPIEGHHFNLKSPNQCGKGVLLRIDEKVAACKMTKPGKQDVELFVCDDKKTFCKREMLPVKVSYPSGIKGWMDYLF